MSGLSIDGIGLTEEKEQGEKDGCKNEEGKMLPTYIWLKNG